MIDFNTITPCLFDVLGWKNTLDTCEKTLDPTVFVGGSETGMFYNLQSELLTLENMQAIAPNEDLFNYPDWKRKNCLLVKKSKENTKSSKESKISSC